MKNEFGTFDYYVRDHWRLINRVAKYLKKLGLTPWQRAVISSFVDRAYCMGGDFAGAMMFRDLKKERAKNRADKNRAIITIHRMCRQSFRVDVQQGGFNNKEMLEIADHLKTYINEQAIDTVIAEVEKPPITERDMYLNMQYYMEYCQMKGYVTPMEWIEKHKHF